MRWLLVAVVVRSFVPAMTAPAVAAVTGATSEGDEASLDFDVATGSAHILTGLAIMGCADGDDSRGGGRCERIMEATTTPGVKSYVVIDSVSQVCMPEKNSSAYAARHVYSFIRTD